MHLTAIKKMELMEKISHLPEQKLDEVSTFVDSVLAQSEIGTPKPINLRGIWKHRGFERIQNLESEIRDVREELSDSILKREI